MAHHRRHQLDSLIVRYRWWLEPWPVTARRTRREYERLVSKLVLLAVLVGEVTSSTGTAPAPTSRSARPPLSRGSAGAGLLDVGVVQLGELGVRRIGGEVRLHDLVEPGVVKIDRIPDLDDRDAAVLHDRVVSDEALGLSLGGEGFRGDLVLHLGGHAGHVMLLQDRHGDRSLGAREPGLRDAVTNPVSRPSWCHAAGPVVSGPMSWETTGCVGFATSYGPPSAPSRQKPLRTRARLGGPGWGVRRPSR